MLRLAGGPEYAALLHRRRGKRSAPGPAAARRDPRENLAAPRRPPRRGSRHPRPRPAQRPRRPLLSAAAADIIRAQNALFAIQTQGVELKDPATGLLDFPALRDGAAIYLCWRYNEPQVAFWHPIETGFAGRRPIEE